MEEKTTNNKLTEIQSLHEQREAISNPEIIVKEGVWIEIINLVLETEKVEVLRRFEVEKVEEKQVGDIKKYKVICKELNIEEMRKQRREAARLVLQKHSEMLKASFAKCLVDGIASKSIQQLKAMSDKLKIYEEKKEGVKDE